MSNNTDILLDLFSRYENKELSKTETEQFELRLNNEAEFKEEFEHFQLSNKLIFEAQLFQLRDEIGNFHEAEISKAKQIKKWLMISAGVITIGLLGLYLYFNQTQKVETQPINTQKDSSTIKSIQKSASLPVEKSQEIEKPFNTHIKKIENNSIASTSNLGNSNLNIQTPAIDNIPVIDHSVIQNPNINTIQKTNNATNPCDQVSIQFDTKTQATCGDKKQGSIIVQQIEGGNSPYQILINEHNYNNNSYINSLDSGSYQVKIIDKLGCVSNTKTVAIPFRLCDINEVLKLSINEKWTLDAGIADKVIIMDKMDKIIYQHNGNDQLIWGGTDSNGQELSPGIYFIYVYKNNHLIQKGSITISY